jgi:hypothetical protein
MRVPVEVATTEDDCDPVDTAISSGETVNPPNRQADPHENDKAQNNEPQHQVA